MEYLAGVARTPGGLPMSEPNLCPTEATGAPRSRTAIRQAWIERLQRFANSGLTPAQFCAKEAVSLPSFYSWKRRLAALPDGTTKPDTDNPGPSLLPIRLPSLPALLELALPTGAVLRIPPGVDEDTLRCLLRLLGVASC